MLSRTAPQRISGELPNDHVQLSSETRFGRATRPPPGETGTGTVPKGTTVTRWKITGSEHRDGRTGSVVFPGGATSGRALYGRCVNRSPGGGVFSVCDRVTTGVPARFRVLCLNFGHPKMQDHDWPNGDKLLTRGSRRLLFRRTLDSILRLDVTQRRPDRSPQGGRIARGPRCRVRRQGRHAMSQPLDRRCGNACPGRDPRRQDGSEASDHR